MKEKTGRKISMIPITWKSGCSGICCAADQRTEYSIK